MTLDDSGIRVYRWAYTARHVLYLQDKDGDDNGRLYSVIDERSAEDIVASIYRDCTISEDERAW